MLTQIEQKSNLVTLTEKDPFSDKMVIPYYRTTTPDDDVVYDTVLCKRNTLVKGSKRKMFCDLNMAAYGGGMCGVFSEDEAKHSFTSCLFHRRPTSSHKITMRSRPCMRPSSTLEVTAPLNMGERGNPVNRGRRTFPRRGQRQP